MARKYRTYSVEFKRSLIAQIDSGAITKAAAAREHDISTSLIDRWQKKIHEGSLQDRPTKREKELEKELDRYKKKVGELALQVDLLKKLNGDLAYTKRSNGCVVTGKKSDQSPERAE